ncbi:MAG: ABC transporter ATP-binding protein [Spirochaetales bacterium]|nr:ABC transporter ATP-binding protein [Spirochaetales bacterium]
MANREFTIEKEYHYNRKGPVQWIISHAGRYWFFPLATLLAAVINNFSYSGIHMFIGKGFDVIVKNGWLFDELLTVIYTIILLAVFQGVTGLVRNYSIEFLAQRIERDSREELFASLLGKSQSFHGRQMIGDIMARCTNDVRSLNYMFSPGVMLIIDSGMGLIAPFVLIGFLDYRLLPIPVLFTIFLFLTVWDYNRRLEPVSYAERNQFGVMNSELAETVQGFEVIKANSREGLEQDQFKEKAALYRDYYIKQGDIQARYYPMLVFTVCWALAFLYSAFLWQQKIITVGQLVSFMGLMSAFRFPTFISLFSFNLVQMGIAGAKRILELINARSDVDENTKGISRPIKGQVKFDNVSFGYGEKKTLNGLSFSVEPGQTIAIVGKTGSGKTTLTRLVNRIYDCSEGAILIDGKDVREWSLASLRQQIASIEQDVFLFSKTIRENIAFGCPDVDAKRVEEVARAACAHDFIISFKEGYDTVIGERGVTLSGGQKQRLAIARAFLTDPKILILDDSTSAIDSATEDQIQQAMHRISRERTTFIITHRLSQIRWADRILVLNQGCPVSFGSHEELLKECGEYRRIFLSN